MDIEQWKSDGNCALCRKNNYCKTDCTAHKRHIEKVRAQAFHDVMVEKYPELAQIMEDKIDVNK